MADTYAGVRYRYGAIAPGGIPAGYICGSRRPDSLYAGGTVDFPAPLPEILYVRFQLVYLGRIAPHCPAEICTSPCSDPDTVLRAMLLKSLEMTTLARALPAQYGPLAGRIVCALSLSQTEQGEYRASIADRIREALKGIADA